MNQSEGTYVDFEIDYSEVAGRLVECPPECGMCCLCQPEVLPDERPFFRKNHPSALVRSRGPEPYTALALKKGRGSCVFLNGRRCSVYQHRPTYCRQFPYHLYASDRLQVELDLSCRGAWTGKGASALDEARMLVSSAEGRIAEALEQSKAVYSEFYANCREAGVMADPSGLRMSVSENLGMFSDLSYLGKIMDMSQIEPIMSVRGIQPDRQPDMKGLTEVGMEAAMESMSSEDPLSVPVYCDPQWNWNMFMAVDGTIEWMVMDDEGELHHKAFVDADAGPVRRGRAPRLHLRSEWKGQLHGKRLLHHGRERLRGRHDQFVLWMPLGDGHGSDVEDVAARPFHGDWVRSRRHEGGHHVLRHGPSGCSCDRCVRLSGPARYLQITLAYWCAK